jgi:serine/threonine protein kinase
LSHPGIVALYSVIPSLDVDYHILELCFAGNLTDFLSLRNPPTLSDREIWQLAKDVGAALAYLKQEKIIHRNICGSNTLITKGFQAVCRLLRTS